MIEFKTIIKRFDKQGEKTGWTYINIPEALALELKPGNKKSFRVKGKLDQYAIVGVALIPVGGGDFIMALNTAMRKAIGKAKGHEVNVKLEVDGAAITIPEDFKECLEFEPEGFAFYKTLAPSHQLYFIRWIDSAKTDATRTKRIAQAVNALANQQPFNIMLRSMKKDKLKEI
jgi:hypothetical protein